jgi:hypothetical protein
MIKQVKGYLMARKNHNNTHQRNAERKARKVNRLAANSRKARGMKSELFERSSRVDYKRTDIRFDRKTEQIFSVAVKVGDELRTHVGICPQSDSREVLMAAASGIMLMYDNCEGAICLRFPPSWIIERVVSKGTTDAWGITALMEIGRNPGMLLYSEGDKFSEFVFGMVDSFVDWVADCGEVPDSNGIVEADVESTCISHVRYDTHQRKMRITFQKGGTWEYDDVPRKRFTGLVSAESVGKYFWRNILDFYECRQVA